MKLVEINTKDLIIRNFKLEDINKSYIKWLNDKELFKYSINKFRNFKKKDCYTFLKNFTSSNNLFLSIKNKKLELLGTITCYFSNYNKICDIGILIGNNKYRSKGFGYKAWSEVMNFLKKNYKIKKISAGTVAKNISMIRIFKKSGMVYDGFRRKNFYENKLLDLVFYAKYYK
jgi:RimJ/RimL family protein N-acetyltransferase